MSVLAITCLLLAASGDRRATAFSLDVADNTTVTELQPGQTLCQGPITTVASFSALEFWVSSADALDVAIRRPRAGRPPAYGRIIGSSSPTGQTTFVLRGAPIAHRTVVTVCIRNAGAATVAFGGGPPTRASGLLAIDGRRSDNAIALLFLTRNAPSLLALLPKVFERASLFKLSFVGAWTFWLLAAALLGAVLIAGVALGVAIRDDADPGTSDRASPAGARAADP
jgi:hypothetical protein